MPDTHIKWERGYLPGLLADIVAAHMAYYAPAWEFGVQFETKVASELAEFLRRYDPDRDLIVSATRPNGAFLGSIVLDGNIRSKTEGAHLRWFITTNEARGTGLGLQLLKRAVQFSDSCGYSLIYLTTFPGLDAARHLYETNGFRLVDETAEDAWSGSVGEQRFERSLICSDTLGTGQKL